MRNLDTAMEAARRLRLRKVAIAIDDAGPEWLSLTELSNFPFVEFKVGRKFVAGCAEDRLKQSICRRILELANSYGSRTVADGIETWSDFLTVRDLGFDLVQGSLFAKPMSTEKFAQTAGLRPRARPPRHSRSRPNGSVSQATLRNRPKRASSLPGFPAPTPACDGAEAMQVKPRCVRRPRARQQASLSVSLRAY